MKSDYNPNQLGMDRWLQMLGVVEKDKKLCVVGCGTALTIDLIDCDKDDLNNRGHHLGGYIFRAFTFSVKPCSKALGRLVSRTARLTISVSAQPPKMRYIMAFCCLSWGRLTK